MLRSIVQLSLKSVYSTELLRTTGFTTATKCRYCKWSSRRAVEIVNEDEVFGTESVDEAKTIEKERGRASRYHREKQRAKKKKTLEKADESEEAEDIVKKEDKPIYKALKEDDKLITSLMIDIKTKKKRAKSNQMLLEGFRLIEDALQGGAIPKVIFFNRLSDLQKLSLPKEVTLYKIPYRTIQLWSNLTTSPGLIGIFEIPNISAKQPDENAIPLTIICDNIREPGNLGSIIRTAAAVGCEKLLLMKGCVDLWEPKVLRGATGAHFRLPIYPSLSWSDIPALISNESAVYLADNKLIYDEISQSDTVNSESNENEINAERNIINTNSDYDITNFDADLLKTYKLTAKTRSLVKKVISQFPVVPYHTTDFAKKEMVLVTGGETEGISLQSCELLRARDCTRVNVSLANNIESLNIVSAVSIIAFEMRRQFITRTLDDK